MGCWRECAINLLECNQENAEAQSQTDEEELEPLGILDTILSRFRLSEGVAVLGSSRDCFCQLGQLSGLGRRRCHWLHLLVHRVTGVVGVVS